MHSTGVANEGTSGRVTELDAAAFLALAATGVTGSAWLLVAGCAAHGFKDLCQHRNWFVAGTRWWPPFCAAVDFLVAAILAVGVVYGMSFH